MLIIYRISEESAGYKKVKPNYINNENCLKNALRVFPPRIFKWLIIMDNISNNTYLKLEYILGDCTIKRVSIGNGAGTFNIALDEALKSEEEYFYFIENDYVHLPNSPMIIQDAFELGADYVNLYDHPDKYLSASQGGNPYIEEDNSEVTKLYLGKYCHFKLNFSATMTFAATKKSLKRDEAILRKWTNIDGYPRDFDMFTELTKQNGQTMLCPIPGCATHGEVAWLAPLPQYYPYLFDSLEEEWMKECLNVRNI